MHSRAAELIAELGLRPHPEGGYYREIFRSASQVSPSDHRGRRAALTTIYFLLAGRMYSRWHAVRSDEVWHLYEGGPLELLELDPSTLRLRRHRLTRVGAEGAPVHTVAAGVWQAACPVGEFALAGCTVAPGFEFADFRLLADDAATAATIRSKLPEVASFI